MTRLPVRVRLTAGFAVAMAVVLAVTGLFVYRRVAADLTHTLDRGLDVRSDDVVAAFRREELPVATIDLRVSGEAAAQILDVDGTVLSASAGYHDRPIVSTDQAARATHHAVFVDRTLPRRPGTWRILARPATVAERRLIVAVASPLQSRDDALADLRRQLLVGGPVAPLLASVVAYGLATAALRPVDRMRRHADRIVGAGDERLPVSPARDELHRLADTLNRMLARIDAGVRRERQFLADASHELRTPLGLLKTELDLALRRPRSPEELRDALRSAAEETDRLSQLANDLLLLALADDGVLPIEPSPVNVPALLDTIAARFKQRARDHGRAIEADADAVGQLTGDPLRLEQALTNLVDNSLRYGAGTVRLTAQTVPGGTALHVRDHGAGYPPQLLPVAFERFSQADSARGPGGTGLGLAIVAAIAVAHGGTAHATNLPGGGTDTWLEVPA